MFEMTVGLAVLMPLSLAAGMAWLAARRQALYWSDGVLVVGAPVFVCLAGRLVNDHHPDWLALTLDAWGMLVIAVLAFAVRVLLLDRFLKHARATSIVLMSGMALWALINGATTRPMTFGF